MCRSQASLPHCLSARRACLFSFNKHPLSAPQGKLCGRFKMNQTHPSLFSRVPFFPSSRPCVCPASLSLCPSALALLCLPVSVTPSAGLCARLSLSPCLPSPSPVPLSPLLNHLNHCVLATQPRLSGSSDTPRGDNPESHTHVWMPAQCLPDPRPLLSRPQTPLCDW